MLRRMVGVIASQASALLPRWPASILASNASAMALSTPSWARLRPIPANKPAATIQRRFMAISTFISYSSTGQTQPFSAQCCSSCPESIGLMVCRCQRRQRSTPAATMFRIGEAPLRPTNGASDFLRTPALLKRQIRTRARASGSCGTSVAAAGFQTARLEAEEASTMTSNYPGIGCCSPVTFSGNSTISWWRRVL